MSANKLIQYFNCQGCDGKATILYFLPETQKPK